MPAKLGKKVIIFAKFFTFKSQGLRLHLNLELQVQAGLGEERPTWARAGWTAASDCWLTDSNYNFWEDFFLRVLVHMGSYNKVEFIEDFGETNHASRDIKTL